MTSALRFSARYWLIGIALAITGVSANRLLAPLFDARPRSAVAVAGELVAIAGLCVIVVGINRRLRLAGEPANASADTDTSTSSPETGNAGNR